MVLLLATGNSGKVAEVKAILHNLLSQPDFVAVDSCVFSSSSAFSSTCSEDESSHCPDKRVILKPLYELDTPVSMPEETGSTYEENSKLKASVVAEKTGMITIADDSGLEVVALDGRPGLYSSRYGTSDSDRIRRLLSELDGRMPASARFVCVATVAAPGGFTKSFEGFVSGEIVGKQSGSSGFGFDPVFQVKGTSRTMAELSSQEKNLISHRAVAFTGLFRYVLGTSSSL